MLHRFVDGSPAPTYAGVVDTIRAMPNSPGIEYDLAGNITSIPTYAGIDGVRQEERTYQYDFLDRLTYAGVYAGPQMIEERYYNGSLQFTVDSLQFRSTHRREAAGKAVKL